MSATHPTATVPPQVADLAPIDGTPKRWTSLNIVLHWTIVGLLVVQFAAGPWMAEAFRASLLPDQAAGTSVSVIAMGHMLLGTTILLLAALRFYDSRKHGRPAHFEAEPGWARMLAAVTHYSLYAFLIGMPIAGLIAYFGGLDWLADLHSLAAKLLIATIALHVTGALVTQFVFKGDVIKRMAPSRARTPEADAVRGSS